VVYSQLHLKPLIQVKPWFSLQIEGLVVKLYIYKVSNLLKMARSTKLILVLISDYILYGLLILILYSNFQQNAKISSSEFTPIYIILNLILFAMPFVNLLIYKTSLEKRTTNLLKFLEIPFYSALILIVFDTFNFGRYITGIINDESLYKLYFSSALLIIEFLSLFQDFKNLLFRIKIKNSITKKTIVKSFFIEGLKLWGLRIILILIFSILTVILSAGYFKIFLHLN